MELESKPLNWWMNNLRSMSRDIWLWISSETVVLTPDTVCYIVDDDIDLSAKEQNQRDTDLEKIGLMCFFLKDQLEDIELNLKEQQKDYDAKALYLALNYYWENDAFIDLSNV